MYEEELMMQEIIRQKLEQIDELFPPARLALSKERWRRLWHGEAPLDRYPFVYTPYLLNYYGAGFTAEERLLATLEEIITRGTLQDDFIPAFFPGCRQSTIPSMFGAEEIVVGDDYTCRRLLASPDDIDRLPEPSVVPARSPANGCNCSSMRWRPVKAACRCTSPICRDRRMSVGSYGGMTTSWPAPMKTPRVITG